MDCGPITSSTFAALDACLHLWAAMIAGASKLTFSLESIVPCTCRQCLRISSIFSPEIGELGELQRDLLSLLSRDRRASHSNQILGFVSDKKRSE